MENQEHHRRVRYKGTHPKDFAEKYKELQPEKYAQDVAKVISRGATPAGMHRSICVDEILDFLKITTGQVGLDATLGYGGHSLEMLKCLNFSGCLYATDVDSLELPRTTQRLRDLGYSDEYLKVRQTNFANIDKIAGEAGPLNFVLADLGVSSMQIDN
ncbi:MAG: 16S rRNA (cytosine(1402)-N(4))-methyltransferase, partial [Oscillospiraceae bacterium]